MNILYVQFSIIMGIVMSLKHQRIVTETTREHWNTTADATDWTPGEQPTDQTNTKLQPAVRAEEQHRGGTREQRNTNRMI